MTRTEEVERLPCWKDSLCSNDHINQHIVSLCLHQLGGAPEGVDGKISLRHFACRPLHLFQVDASLDWTDPENVFPSNHFESSVRTSDSLIDRPSSPRRIASESRWNI